MCYNVDMESLHDDNELERLYQETWQQIDPIVEPYLQAYQLAGMPLELLRDCALEWRFERNIRDEVETLLEQSDVLVIVSLGSDGMPAQLLTHAVNDQRQDVGEAGAVAVPDTIDSEALFELQAAMEVLEEASRHTLARLILTVPPFIIP